ncbi:MAG: dihydroneopterin aldolase [Planctomycetota bacterium]
MASNDCIHIRDLRVRGIVGINDWERGKPQDLIVSLTLYHDLEPAARSDEIDDTFHYGTISKAIVAYVQAAEHRLIETLAREICRIGLEHGADRVRVRLDKPWAVENAVASVEIERTRADFE